jgi:ribosomal protein S18 acetylase RimI-like enzyme
MREFYAIEHLAFDEQSIRVSLRQLISNESYGRVFIARPEDGVAGYAVLTYGFSLEFRGRNALVDELYVREEFRGRGIGRSILRHLEEFCRGQQICALRLEVARANTGAQSLYRREGYMDHDRYLLTKRLGGE